MSSVRMDQVLASCRIANGSPLDLAARDTDVRVMEYDKVSGKMALAAERARIAALQGRMAAERRHALLCIFQSMDAGGKDSTIRQVLKGADPGSLHVSSFKAPSLEEQGHDFLRRMAPGLPARGEIAVFNRSYYEEVLITRIHPHLLAAEHLPDAEADATIWRGRLEDIAAHERYLTRQGITILKFYLHISKGEQRRRFLRRLRRPDKIWKFDAADMAERVFWDDYATAYSEAIGETAAPAAPWLVIPADRKWVARLLVAATIRQTLQGLDPQFPVPDEEARQAAENARRDLEAEA
jgi:PPK2 family polyphosphate:nucleotide phosphotransferase